MVVTVESLATLPAIRHGFFTRRGGVSAGLYASLNCGPGSADDPAAVRENRMRVAAALGGTALCTLCQVHGADVVTLNTPLPGDRPEDRPRADAMVTDRPGLALGILTADCAPVLFADAASGVVGACHAGWRGALAGVTDATVAAMEKLGARRDRVAVAIGPTIAAPSYEVGPEFPAPFLAADTTASRFFSPSSRAGHFMFDLPAYLRDRLDKAGLGAVHDTATDTLTNEADFFSFRRTTLRGEKDYGRQISAIALAP
jgi:YfiH family protein